MKWENSSDLVYSSILSCSHFLLLIQSGKYFKINEYIYIYNRYSKSFLLRETTPQNRYNHFFLIFTLHSSGFLLWHECISGTIGVHNLIFVVIINVVIPLKIDNILRVIKQIYLKHDMPCQIKKYIWRRATFIAEYRKYHKNLKKYDCGWVVLRLLNSKNEHGKVVTHTYNKLTDTKYVHFKSNHNHNYMNTILLTCWIYTVITRQNVWKILPSNCLSRKHYQISLLNKGIGYKNANNKI